MTRRGTEAFSDMGAHCDEPDCNQLDFLPFVCDGCDRVFCLKHRTYVSHGCAKAADQGRTVVICEACGVAIERAPGQDDRAVLDAHAKTRSCDAARKRKPRCPVRRCKEALTFSNTSACKQCGQKTCLKHRFPGDHDCAATIRAAVRAAAEKRVGMCGRDSHKKKANGGGLGLPPLVGNFKIF